MASGGAFKPSILNDVKVSIRRTPCRSTLNLHFNGNCREVFEFYRSVFGGDFTWFSTFRDMPDPTGIAEEEMDQVLHASLDIGGTTLMGSDVPRAFGPPVDQGNNFSVSCQTESREQTEELFRKISEGGEVTMPLDDMFWGAYFGSCTDRFGINWMFNCENPQAHSGGDGASSG